MSPTIRGKNIGTRAWLWKWRPFCDTKNQQKPLTKPQSHPQQQQIPPPEPTGDVENVLAVIDATVPGRFAIDFGVDDGRSVGSSLLLLLPLGPLFVRFGPANLPDSCSVIITGAGCVDPRAPSLLLLRCSCCCPLCEHLCSENRDVNY